MLQNDTVTKRAANFLLAVSIVNLFFWALRAGEGFGRMAKFSLQKLTHDASHVIVGKVVAKESSWNPEKTKIYTDITISVHELIKGSLKGREITIRHLGGEIPEEDIGMKVSDMAEFNVGEDVLVFVRHGKGENKYRLVGKAQGKCTLKNGIVLEYQLILGDFSNKIKDIIRAQMP